MKLTSSDPQKGKRLYTADEPDWKTAFVLAPSTLRLIYDSADRGYALRDWASKVVPSRLGMHELYIFSKNELPDGYISHMYHASTQLAKNEYCSKLEDTEKKLKKQIKLTAEVELCLQSGSRPHQYHRCETYAQARKATIV
jgi:hypothetical protein